MDALVCRRTLTGHRHSVLCITGMDLLGQKHHSHEVNGTANGMNGQKAPPLLVSHHAAEQSFHNLLDLGSLMLSCRISFS